MYEYWKGRREQTVWTSGRHQELISTSSTFTCVETVHFNCLNIVNCMEAMLCNQSWYHFWNFFSADNSEMALVE